MGLLHEILVTNHTSMNIKNYLGMENKENIIKFYGLLAKSLKNVKIEDFKSICFVFFNLPSLPFFEIFVKQNCVIENQKISLKSEKES